VFENRVLRRIFGPKRENVAGGWRKLHNEELHNLYVSPNIIRVIKSRRMRWGWHMACIEEMRNSVSILLVKLRRSMHRWEDNIRMNFQERRWSVWIECFWLRIAISDEPL
jgi:hypothetical protein